MNSGDERPAMKVRAADAAGGCRHRRAGVRAAAGLLAAAAVFAVFAVSAPGASAAPSRRVVLFTMPGITWEDVRAARTPALDRLIRDGAVAAMSVRTAFFRSDPARGYLTLGAGNRAFLRNDDPAADLAYPAGTHVENGTAAQALRRRMGTTRPGGIVHLGLPYLATQTRTKGGFGTLVGSLGEALRRDGVPRAVVAAGDLKPGALSTQTMRRTAVLGVVDRRGSVDAGTVEGLVVTDPTGAFGVRTDPGAFDAAVRTALTDARLVLADPGETLRADAFALESTPEQRRLTMALALQRSDEILGRVAAMLRPGDVLYVVAVSSPSAAVMDQLTPIVRWTPQGADRGWLTSPSTRRDGIVTLTDVAPTVLADLGVDEPPSMTGTPVRVVRAPASGRVGALMELNRESLFRERFVAVAAAGFIALLVIVAVLAFAFFFTGSRGLGRFLRVAAYAILAVPPATLLGRAIALDALGLAGASVVFYALVTALVIVAFLVPGPRWSGGVALLLLSAGLLTGDLLTGARWQLNGAFGYSPIVGGRFYGIGNLGFAMLFASGFLGLTGLADLRGADRAPTWLGLGLAALVVVDGLPQFGADFGGVLAGVPAVAVTVWMARGRRIRWRSLLALGATAVALAVLATLADLARAPESRTHLGRFAARVAAGGFPALWEVVARKAAANVGLFGFSVWTFAIPVALSVLALLLWRPRGILRDVIPQHPVLRAGLAGALVAGVAGFAVNDSGIAIPAMVLGHVVPLLVLMGVETVLPGADAAGAAPAGAAIPDHAARREP